MKELRITFPAPCGEKWEDMPSTGCNRLCTICDTTIHDLSKMEFKEAEALLTEQPDACVRAVVSADGTVRLKEKTAKKSGKMVIAAGAAMGLMLAAAPTFSKAESHRGSVSGKFVGYFAFGSVTATDANGTVYTAKVSRYGRYKFKNLPDGVYVLRFDTQCGQPWVSGPVLVQNGSKSKLPPVLPDDSECIIIGSVKLDQNIG